MNAGQLQKKHKRFIYEKFEHSFRNNGLLMKFLFKIEPGITFTPNVFIRSAAPFAKKLSRGALDNFVFHIGLAEVPSYWKCAISPEIEIVAGYLNNGQIKWWRKLLINGLGEFFYENGVNPEILSIKITSSSKKRFPAAKTAKEMGGFLVPVGGGKDSLVVLKTISGSGRMGTMVLGNVAASYNLIKSLGLK